MPPSPSHVTRRIDFGIVSAGGDDRRAPNFGDGDTTSRKINADANRVDQELAIRARYGVASLRKYADYFPSARPDSRRRRDGAAVDATVDKNAT